MHFNKIVEQVLNEVTLTNYHETYPFLLGYAAITFRKKTNPWDPYESFGAWVLGGRKDTWFAKTEGTGKGYGLMIRELKITSRTPVDDSTAHALVYKAKMKYIPIGQDDEELTDVWLYVHRDVTLESVLKFVEQHKHEWVP